MPGRSPLDVPGAGSLEYGHALLSFSLCHNPMGEKQGSALI